MGDRRPGEVEGELSAEDRQLLAYLLEQEAAAQPARQSIQRRPEAAVPPLSFAQERMWFLHVLEPGSPLYSIPAALRLVGTLDVEALRKTLSAIVARHEVLRTTFVVEGGRPQPIVAPAQELPLRVEDLSAYAAEERAAELERRRRREARTPFDLEHGPLIRATLLRLGEQEHALLLAMHHIVSDAWSIGVMLAEIRHFYEAFLQGRAPSLPELPVAYADFAHWQREWLRGEVLETQLAYWRRQLEGAPQMLELPTDHARPSVRTVRGGAVRGNLDAGLLEDLTRMARREGATLFMVLLAAFKALLGRYSGQTDLVVGSPIANRTRREVEGLIGFFVNTLVLRTDLSGDPSFRELVHRVREVSLEAYAHQDVPFEKLVEVLRPERALSHSPVFQVVFNLQNAPGDYLQLPGLTVSPIETTTETAKFDLALYVMEAPAGLRMSCEYNADLFEAATIQRMLGHYRRLLEAAVVEPEARLTQLALLGNEEREQLVVEWNRTARPYPATSVPAVFEAQALRTPNAVAVVCGAERLTYAELDSRSNQLARYLRRQGVGLETRVGICVERSVELIVGLLAILKAGGAYVPLDPEYPTERLGFMVRDAGLSVLLTQERLLDRLGEAGAKALCLDRLNCSESSASLDLTLDSERLAYVTYTSGSTGIPKGVEVRQRGVLRLVLGADYAEFGPDEVFLQLAPVSFDASTLEIWGPLLNGGKCVLFPSRVPTSKELGEVLRREGVTTLWLTSSLYNAVIDESPEVLGSLKQLLIGGEALSVAHVKRGYERLKTTQIINGYGPTEGTTFTCCHRIPRELGEARSVPIGRPIANTRVYVLDARLEPAPVGLWGELFIGGDGVARGYLGRPELTAERFVPDLFSEAPGQRLYRTGDVVRWLRDGTIEFLGRRDEQVKVRGYRIELGEIEAVLAQAQGVKRCAVVVREDVPGDKRLVAYLVWEAAAEHATNRLRDHLRAKLPEYMMPGAFVVLDDLPLSPNGKVDRKALPAPEGRAERLTEYVEPVGEVERAVAGVWREVLGAEKVGLEDNFFDLGGHSLLLVQVHSRLLALYPDRALSVVDLFRFPTVRALSAHLGGGRASSALARVKERARRQKESRREPVAIIGMTGRFPRARGVAEFWRHLREGRECISFFTDEELLAARVSSELLKDPSYVKARAVLDDVELFDARFFGYTPREAEIMDPQQRVFLECAWEAMETAGYDAESYPGLVGVYAGVSLNRYLARLTTRPDLLSAVGGFSMLVGSDKDFLPTRVSYKLNLRGPSVNVQTACSTSLVAVHLAVQGLLGHECDLALAGGVSISVPQTIGYRYEVESIGSPDGHCRAFDARAAGTVGGSGVAIVVLKRLSDALRDGDTVHALIKGSAINNDGALKVGYTAPSVEGQAEVIAAAQAVAGVDPGTITYVEAHGTGTSLGDPIEVEALTQAFREGTDRKGYCALGSVKTNVGHLDAAAGTAGLIKAALAVEHGEIPPSLHFEEPNPKIDFAKSPFFVNTELRRWEGAPVRRAGVSSFGIGGTNAHVVLEEAPPREPSEEARPWQLLVLSAKTEASADRAVERLRAHLGEHPELNLADVAWTLGAGRHAFKERRAVVVRDAAEAARVEAGGWRRGSVEGTAGTVAFLFTGQGSQYPNMGRGLYESERVFRQAIDACSEILRGPLGLDLRDVLYPPAGEEERAAERLKETALTQPALFALEHALARLWMSWGVEPAAMIGHSVGEYVAAELAGVFTLEEALLLVAERGRLMQAMPRGSMLAVPLAEPELLPLLGPRAPSFASVGPELSLAAVNGPAQCVISGETGAVETLRGRLRERGIETRLLETSHAFHSSMMDGMLDAYRERVSRVALKAPRSRFVSNLTGDWITAEQARDPGYWTAQLRRCVRFGDGLARLVRDTEGSLLLEVGPGAVLTNLAQTVLGRDAAAVSSLRGSKEGDRASMLKALGRLWLGGVPVDWEKVHAGERRRRVPLPAYAFERQRYWVEAGAERAVPTTLVKKTDVGGWFYVPGWRSSVAERLGAPPSVDPGRPWLILGEAEGAGAQLAERVRRAGGRVAWASPGERFERRAESRFTLRLGAAEDYRLLVAELHAQGLSPRVVVHAASAVAAETAGFESELDRGFYSLLFLLQALGNGTAGDSVRLLTVSSRQHDVTGGEPVVPERLALLGLAQVAAQEQPKLTARCVDVALAGNGRLDEDTLERLFEEGLLGAAGAVVALRKGRRWLQVYEPVRLPEPSRESLPLRDGGTYLVTGGLGEIGLEVAEYLARTVRARLVLVGRTGLPPREHWGSLDGAADPRARRVQKIRALEALGAQVLPLEADVADGSRMRAVVAEAEARFGALHGVVHAAGTTRGRSFAPLAQLGRAECEEQLRAKARGLIALEEALEGRRLDFRVLMSSLSAVLGGLSMGAYAAANLFMDGFCAAREGWTSIDWDGWRLQESGRSESAGSLAALAMTRSEGMEAFERALAARGLSRLVVSTGDLGLRLDQWVTRPAADGAPEAAAEAPAPHSRPALGSEYLAPRDATEQAIVEIWQELLGLQPLGVEDDFFELGGHSLLATQVMSRLRDAFGVEVPLRVLFERPTVAGLAAHVSAVPRRGREARVAELVERLKSMSPDERRALLEQEKLAREHA